MIETERLRLRRWREADLPAFAAMNADPNVRRYFSSRLTREESDASVARFIRMYALDGYAFMATELRKNSEFIGLLGIQRMSFVLPGRSVSRRRNRLALQRKKLGKRPRHRRRASLPRPCFHTISSAGSRRVYNSRQPTLTPSDGKTRHDPQS